jgi:hypothetical protein
LREAEFLIACEIHDLCIPLQSPLNVRQQAEAIVTTNIRVKKKIDNDRRGIKESALEVKAYQFEREV